MASDNQSTTYPITARCHCNQSSFILPLPISSLPLHADFCHCNSCRHGTGTMAMLAASLVTGLPKEAPTELATYAFSPRVQVYFCGKCGTWIFWHSKEMEYTAVFVGALELSSKGGDKVKRWKDVLTISEHMWIESTADGGMSSWLPSWQGTTLNRWTQHANKSDACPSTFGSDAATQPVNVEIDAREESLHVHCLCKGVDFTISRPTDEDAKKAPWWLDPITKSRYRANLCVCDDCRLACGNEIMPWMMPPLHNIMLPSGKPAGPNPDDLIFGTVKCWRSTEHVSRYFCGTCGATVFWVGDERPDVPDVAVGLLAPRSGNVRAEEWLQWAGEDGHEHARYGKISNEEDGQKRGLLFRDLKEGIVAWKKSLGIE